MADFGLVDNTETRNSQIYAKVDPEGLSIVTGNDVIAGKEMTSPATSGRPQIA